MFIYLMQHGKAMSKEESPERPLNHEGVRECNEMASVIKRFEFEVKAIYHSPKVRAKESAELIAGAFSSREGLVERDDLNPNDDVESFKSFLLKKRADVVVVGHLPFLDRLTNSLLGSTTGSEGAVHFKNSGLLCLEEREGGKFAVNWLLTPQIIDML